MRENVAVTVSIYYALSLGIFLAALLFPSRFDYATEIPVMVSLLLLFPLYLWQRSYQKRAKLSEQVETRDKQETLSIILALYILALSVRIPSVLLFNAPYEKTPLLYLLLLTILTIEHAELRTFGFKTQKIGKSIVYGLLFFGILCGANLAATYLFIANSTGQNPIQSFDLASFLLAMPFMTFCVGISEEGFFRGYMQTHLEKFYSPIKTVLIQATLFGVWHFVWNLHPLDSVGMIQYVATTFTLGAVFGYFYSKTRNLVPLILAHGLWNTVPPNIVVNAQVISVFSTHELTYQLFVPLGSFITAVLLTFVFVKYYAHRI